ncbi:hypothetical protein N7532_011073 [Penicillium argentinense]|uniref:NADH-ubiquinone oxidoreductase 178 kDa subunit n=1 Tax=Penicillium argentinense TaxID=1131581 RepID=A0A9W9EHY8_9EURO|nr:uncharacterized protein N7532_011073 [Penicillium argentinense]KAJ5082030.1 hypothetical protein N7532_011073 [Penicillium argentinense]
MFAARTCAASSRQLLRTQVPRRFGSSHAHAEPVNESLGRSFYITVGSFASAYLLYRFTTAQKESGSDSFISDLIAKWTPSQETFEQRNAIRTAILEKAAEDRHLLQSEGPREFVPMRQNDMMNSIPIINVAPGSQADLSKVVAYYERENKAAEEARVARMKDGEVDYLYK